MDMLTVEGHSGTQIMYKDSDSSMHFTHFLCVVKSSWLMYRKYSEISFLMNTKLMKFQYNDNFFQALQCVYPYIVFHFNEYHLTKITV